jgi:tetratricopeptide (TPR) repeat protein
MQATRMTARALQLVPSDSLDAGRLLCRYGLLLNLETADDQGAQAALAQALAIARRAGDVALEMRTLANTADVHWYHLRWPEVVSYSVQAIALARRVGESGEAWPFYLAAMGSDLGRLEERAATLQRCCSMPSVCATAGFGERLVAERHRAPPAGDWQAARDWYERGLEVAPTWYLLLGFRVQLEYEVGTSAQTQLYLDKLFAVAQHPLGTNW